MSEIFNLDAEKQFLAAILLDPEQIIGASTIVEPKMMYSPKHRIVFESMQELAIAGRDINTVSVGDMITAKHNGSFGDQSPMMYLTELLGSAATAVNMVSHGEIIAKKAHARRLVDMSQKTIDRMKKGDDPTVVALESQATMTRLQGQSATGDSRIVDASWTAQDLMDTDIPEPESLLGDGVLVRGGFMALYGRPGLGKTWAVLQLALDMAAGRPWYGLQTVPCRVGILELEMHAWFVQDRLRRLLPDVLTKQDKQALANIEFIAKPRFKGRIDILDPNTRTGIATWCREQRLDVMIVDALSRIHQTDENSAQEMGKVLAGVDQIRDDTDAAVVLIHHEPKSSSKNDSGRSMSSDDHLDAARGSARLQSDTHSMLHMWKYRNKTIFISSGKINFGPDLVPICLEQDEFGVLHLAEAPTDPEVVGEYNSQKVLDAMTIAGGAGLTREQLEKATGLKKSTLYKYLKELNCSKCEDGRWRLEGDDGGHLFRHRDDNET